MKHKIMLVDDNLDLPYIVKRGLEKMNDKYEVISANGGKECFELLKDGQIPDLILLDIAMAGMNGWDVFAKLKEKPPWRKIPIVFLTAKTDPYSEGFGKIPADGYIEKPFDMEDLKKRIDKVLKKNQSTRDRT